MAEKKPPTIDSPAARRWQRMPMPESPWLHEEVARRMQDRLDYIKSEPASWVHWMPGLGGMDAHSLLVQRYPKATCTVLETTSARSLSAQNKLTVPWWSPQRWLKPQPQIVSQIDRPTQMLWCNMALHMSEDPQALMSQWQQALEVDGFLMFSCLGPDTLKELRGIYQTLNWPMPNHEFTDMHDWGDMLVAAGFAEPVMDMEHITLTFETPERLLKELRGLGRNLHVGRFGGLRGRRWYGQLLQALGNAPLQLTFEVVYGHAFKPAPRLAVTAQSEISLEGMRQALVRGKMAQSIQHN